MTDYRAPLRSMQFSLQLDRPLERLAALPRFRDVGPEVAEAVMAEAARLAEEVLDPLYRVADRDVPVLEDGQVRVPTAMRTAYATFVEGGWPGLAGPPEYGGQGLPHLLATAVAEMWRSANLAFSLVPMLTESTAEALARYGSDALKSVYLPKLVAGEWTGAMNLTEPQAGSDLAATQATAHPEGDHYRIRGRKIFITWGDHDLTDNIVEFVLARLPDAPAGVKGISLFLVPKYLVNPDGSLGPRNEVVPLALEEKLGIHGSPTCALAYGEQRGAVGYLVGEPNRGLSCMFTVMNRARLSVGVEGLAMAERAYQKAARYARERIQGRPPGRRRSAAIIHHPDVRRMLLLMKAYTEAMRLLTYHAALQVDLAEHAVDAREREAARTRFALLTPIVKGWCTEVCQELVSLALQVHGGVGYVEETGAAQILRDARITTIYEGTTGIQANDLVRRKVMGDGGKAVTALLEEVRGWLAAPEVAALLPKPMPAALGAGIDGAARAVRFLVEEHARDSALAGAAAVNFLLLMGTVLGGWRSARAAEEAARQLAAGAPGEARAFLETRGATARFYAEHILPRAHAHLAAVMAGSESIMAVDETQL